VIVAHVGIDANNVGPYPFSIAELEVDDLAGVREDSVYFQRGPQKVVGA